MLEVGLFSFYYKVTKKTKYPFQSIRLQKKLVLVVVGLLLRGKRRMTITVYALQSDGDFFTLYAFTNVDHS